MVLVRLNGYNELELIKLAIVSFKYLSTIQNKLNYLRSKEFGVRLISTRSIPARLIFTKEAYIATPFLLQGLTFLPFNYIVPKYLKPTIVKLVKMVQQARYT